jgi:type IV secretion system protein VirB10
MAKEPIKPIDQQADKTREEEMAEWNESQSNSMLKAVLAQA